MKTKETPWESRNLGVDSSVEFYFEQGDSVITLNEDVLSNKQFTYQVAHIPVGSIDVVNELLQHGFTFAETKIELTADLKKLTLPSVFERFSEGMSYHKATDSEQEKINASIIGGIFSTDKVALDPHFSACIAGQRYVYWTDDIVKAGVGFSYIVSRNGEPIGFFVLKKSSERIGDSFLAGLFDKDRNSGLGFSVLYYPMVEAKCMGLKKMITGVSSNNPDSVKMHLALGYQIKSMDYTLVKHISKER